jgi:hypothetical protein
MSVEQTASRPNEQPPMRPSKESTKEQLGIAKREGEAYAAALEAMNKESGAQIKRAGDYEIAVVVEDAEGLWELTGEGHLRWQEPTTENAHVEVAVRDATDGRFIPDLEVTATVIGPDGGEVGTHQQPFLWHPWLYHYGRNWRVPSEGDYRIHVRIAAPRFMRHDYKNGRRYAAPVEADFWVHIKPGQKHSVDRSHA